MNREARCLTCVLAVAAWSSVGAATPQLIHYQGRLLNGTNLVSGNVGLSLRLFDASALGSLLYEDSNQVAVADGLYSTFLGDDTTFGALADALTNAAVWVEVAVNGTALAPRERLGSVAYALKSAGADAGAITSDMLADNAITSNKLAAGAVTSNALATGSVTADAIASGAVVSSDILDLTVSGPDLAGNSITVDKMLQTQAGQQIWKRGQQGGDSGVFLGQSLATFGATNEYIVVGIQFGNFGGPPYYPGAAFVYSQGGTRLATVTNPAAGSYDYFGSVVAGLGTNRFIVGAPDDDPGSVTNAGSIYIYTYPTLTTNVIANPTPATSDRFGASISAMGTNLFAVGAPSDDTGAANAGIVYLYNGAGSSQAIVLNGAAASNDNFGTAVAGLTSNRVVVGIPGRDVGTNANAGAVQIFDASGSSVLTINNPFARPNANFGAKVAPIGSNYFAVTASGANPAQVSIYNSSGSRLATVTNPLSATAHGFGNALGGLADNRVLIGAPSFPIGTNSDGGAVFVFSTSGTWLGLVLNPDWGIFDEFGGAVVGLDTNRLVIGDRGDTTIDGAIFLYAMMGTQVAGLIAASVADVPDITRSVNLPITSFLNCDAVNFGAIDFVDNVASAPDFATAGDGRLDLEWDSGDTDPVCTSFRVPDDYASNGVIRIASVVGASLNNDWVGAALVQRAGSTEDTTTANLTGGTNCDAGLTPGDIYTCTLSFGTTINAGDYVTFSLHRSGGSNTMKVYGISFDYTASQ